MLSTPPAIRKSTSPLLMAREAMATASMLEPHRRFTVVAGNFLGKPGEKESHAGNVAIVFARLIGAAENDVVQSVPVDTGVTFEQAL